VGKSTSASAPISVTKTGSGTSAQWTINGGNGADSIDVNALLSATTGGHTGSKWTIVGGNGADTILGSYHSEVIWGDSSGDSSTSDNGADKIYGGAGNDEIHGGNGPDYLQGDDGADHLYGGRGGDVFDYNVVDDSESGSGGCWSSLTGDWIHDFNKSEGDKLDLRGLNSQLTGAGHPDELTWSDSPNYAYGVWIGSYSGGDKIVYADTNGDGVADVAIRVTGSIDSGGISGLNHAPVAHGESNSVTEDQSVNGTVAGNDSDSDGDALSYSVCGTGPTGLSLNANGSYTFDAGSYDWLGQGQTTTVNADVKVSDGHGGIAHETLSITITGVNDAATFSGDTSGDVDETGGGPQPFSIIDPGTTTGHLSVDDVDGADTVQALDTDTDHGHFSIGTDGDWTFTVDQDNAEVQALNDDETITETVTVHSADGTAQDITITIHGANDAAEFTGDYEGDVTEDSGDPITASGDLSVTDVDNPGTINAEEQDGNYGHFSIGADGHWTYTLDNDNTDVNALNDDSTPLTDTFTVTSDDGTEQQVTVTIHGANDAPVAEDDGNSGDEDSIIGGTATASDPDDATLTFSYDHNSAPAGFSMDADGNWQLDASNDAYQHLAERASTDVFVNYTVDDGHGGSDTGTLTITVTGVNDAPEAVDSTGSGSEDDSRITGAVTAATDADDGAALHYSVAPGDEVDGFEMDGLGNWSFDPSGYNYLGAGEHEDVVVTYTVTDNLGATDTATLTITVNGANDAPELTGTAATLTDGTEDTDYTVSAANLLQGWSDPDSSDTLDVANVTADHGTVVDNGDGTYTVTLDANYNGPLTLSYDVTDGTASVPATLGANIDAVNDAPELTGTAATLSNGTEDTPYTVSDTDLLAGWTDVDGDTLSVTGLICDHGSITDNGDGTYSVTLDANYNGPITFNYNVSDGTDPVAASLGATVDAVNDAPELTGSAATLANGTEDTPYTVSDADLLAGWTDVDGDSLSVTGLTCDHGSIVDNGDGTYSVTLDADYNGPITFNYNVTDDTAPVAASLGTTIDAVNDAPALTGTAATLAGGTEDTAYTVHASDLLQGWTDVDGDSLSVTGLTCNHGSVVDNGDGTYAVTLAANYNGPVTFNYSVTDGTASVATSLGATIAAVNDPPALTGTAATLAGGTEDTAYTVHASDLLQGWTDVDGDSLSITGLTCNHGSVVNNGDGTYTVTLTANYNGPITFNYNVTDGTAPVAASLGANIAAVDDAGSIGGTTTGSVTEDAVTNTASGSLTLTDLDGPAGFVTQTNTAGTYGTFSVDSSGSWTYTLNNSDTDTNALNNGDHPTDTFTVNANDGASTSVVITVNGHTDGPSYTSPPVFTGTGDPYDNDNLGLSTGGSITGGSGADTIYGGGGADTINGNGGDDIIYAGSGNDTVDGNNGGDRVYGGSGNDNITGSNGDDILVGGYGADSITGSNGNDTFVYLNQRDTGDTITDFSKQVNNTDKIDLSGGTSTVGAIADPNHVATFYCTTFAGDLGSDPNAPATLGAHSVGFHYNGTNTIVYVDTDGVTGADMEITLSGNIALTSSDFLLHA
jgi:VCBS repeat-containing protein